MTHHRNPLRRTASNIVIGHRVQQKLNTNFSRNKHTRAKEANVTFSPKLRNIRGSLSDKKRPIFQAYSLDEPIAIPASELPRRKAKQVEVTIKLCGMKGIEDGRFVQCAETFNADIYRRREDVDSGNFHGEYIYWHHRNGIGSWKSCGGRTDTRGCIADPINCGYGKGWACLARKVKQKEKYRNREGMTFTIDTKPPEFETRVRKRANGRIKKSQTWATRASYPRPRTSAKSSSQSQLDAFIMRYVGDGPTNCGQSGTQQTSQEMRLLQAMGGLSQKREHRRQNAATPKRRPTRTQSLVEADCKRSEYDDGGVGNRRVSVGDGPVGLGSVEGLVSRIKDQQPKAILKKVFGKRDGKSKLASLIKKKMPMLKLMGGNPGSVVLSHIEVLGQTILHRGRVEVSTKVVTLNAEYVAYFFGSASDRKSQELQKSFVEIARKRKLVVIYISCDSSQTEYLGFFSTMRWHAVKFSDKDRVGLNSVAARYAGVHSFPTLAVYDRKGRLLVRDCTDLVMKRKGSFLNAIAFPDE
eukprot:CAMPEP_0114536476 /NCGR_PEP_ID=MMETSP0109-20121206/29029_1 /TAXON_ID=29199 /ORGANISM="Chlorarachnion reptans, Strain CCCM449" /LENGTH=525 /DNA_ID=CAMNT_0001720229 /DNA_START=62 /DNA_END=1640 /DNA_ORIENTATION=-